MGELSPEREAEIRKDHATPASITVPTNVCDKGILKILAERLLVGEEELAGMCFQRGLYHLAEEYAESREEDLP